MEQLQAAIKKARQQRDGKVSTVSTQPGKKVRSDATDKLWEDIRPFEIDPSSAPKNRIVTFESSVDAAPFDMLRTRLLHQLTENNWTRVAIVSPHSGCGKTTTAVNLAVSLSRQEELRTIVFDLDLRRIGLGKLLGQSGVSSMADILSGRVEFKHNAVRLGKNLAFGLNNRVTPNPSEILQSRKAAAVLEEIEEAYRPNVMLFDLPPLMAADDNFGFLKNVDCAILLAEAGKTTMKQIDIAESQLSELTNVLGIVLNKSRYTSKVYGYEYDYS